MSALATLAFAYALKQPVHHGPRRGAAVALTFDACQSPKMSGRHYNAAVIEALRKSGTPATLFLSGLWIQHHPDEARALAADPLFELANHGQSHRAFRPRCFHLGEVPAPEVAAEIDQPAALLAGLLGHRPAPWFRFPGGCTTAAALRAVAARGLTAVNWDVYGEDGKNPDPAAIVRAVLRGVRPGSIVLLHMNGPPQAPATAQALPAILAGLRARGLTPVKLSQLLVE